MKKSRFSEQQIKIGARCINAAASKPAFRDPFSRGQRWIAPVDGFYESQKQPGGKQPFAIVAVDASRWRWRASGSGGSSPVMGGGGGPYLHHHHRAANEFVAPIHNRNAGRPPSARLAHLVRRRRAQTIERCARPADGSSGRFEKPILTCRTGIG